MAKQILTHRERIETVLAGQRPDRVPVALWRHFPVDDQTPESLAAAALAFQKTYDFDLIKVTPSSSFCLLDWGVSDRWNGATEGTRDYVTRAIKKPEDWDKLPRLDPHAGSLGNQIHCLELLCATVDSSMPVLQTIFSPLSQMKNLVGGDTLLVHLRRYPELIHRALRVITDTTLDFIETLRPLPLAGIFYAVQHAQYGLLSEAEFTEFGMSYDVEILEAAGRYWLNMVHLHGLNGMFDLVSTYPAQVINWHDRSTPPTLTEARQRYSGTLCGGLERTQTMVLGTPDEVRREAEDAIRQTDGLRFILGTGCVLPITAPHANILAARRAVESAYTG
ncbi:MAG TPA: uroporphyrinogen decarboxylase family protein [Anaerolineaceae bacterium]|nr:uroporphyrinogen decarboxylase family protein [Anaerolineaceae bacterium]